MAGEVRWRLGEARRGLLWAPGMGQGWSEGHSELGLQVSEVRGAAEGPEADQ